MQTSFLVSVHFFFLPYDHHHLLRIHPTQPMHSSLGQAPARSTPDASINGTLDQALSLDQSISADTLVPTSEGRARLRALSVRDTSDQAAGENTSAVGGFRESKAKLRALNVLMGLETKPLPSNLSLDQLEPKHSPRTGCFDLAGLPNKCGWQAHSK